MFNTIHPDKAPQQIISQIRTQIFEGKLRPGDKLLPENQLMKQFNVSKQTLREALRALEFIGLIKINKGLTGGATIIEMDNRIAIELMANFLYFKELSIHQLTEVRNVIESYGAGTAANSMGDAEKGMLKDLIELSRKEHESSTSPPHLFRSDLKFHCAIANSTKNPLLILIVDLIESVMADEKTVINPDKEMYASIVSGHERVYNAIVEKNSNLAMTEMSRHITEIEAYMIKLRKKDPRVWR